MKWTKFTDEILESIKKTMSCEEFDALHGEGASEKWASPKVPVECEWPNIKVKE